MADETSENTPNTKQVLSARALSLLVCPKSGSPLKLDSDAQELISTKAKLAYPIRDGVPILLISSARKIG